MRLNEEECMISTIEKAQIKSRLLSLDIKNLKEVAKTLKIDIKTDYNLNELSEYITKKVVMGEINRGNLFNLIDYFKIADKIERKTLGLTKNQLGEILEIKVNKYTKRNDLIDELRIKVLSGDINVNDINIRKIFLRNKIERVKKPETIAYIASRLLGSDVERFTSEDLVKLALEKVNSEKIAEEELIGIIQTAQKEMSAARKRKFEGPTLQKIEKEINFIRNDVAEIKKRLNSIDDERHNGFLRQYRRDTGNRIADFLKKIKMIERGIGNHSEIRYDEFIRELKRNNISIPELFEQAMLICLMNNITDITSTLRFSITKNDFFKVLLEETNKIHFVSRPIIHEVRKVVMKRLEITIDEFNKNLLECRKMGWVNLIEGAPLSAKEDDWLDAAGKRFYYLEIICKEQI
jgi:hypothetical protein